MARRVVAERLIAAAALLVACSSPPGDDADDSAASPDAAPAVVDGAPALPDAPQGRTSCELADGHPCSRWVLTSPDGEYACLGYDNLGAVCQ